MEGLYESLTIELPQQKIILISIYRPTAMQTSSTKKFIEELEKHINTIKKKKEFRHYNIVLMGDFNINLANTNCNYTNDLADMLINKDFTPEINIPTRISNGGRTQTIIDHIWTTKPEKIKGSGIIEDTTFSDHNMTFTTLYGSNKPEKSKIFIREMKEGNIENLKTEIKGKKWETVWKAKEIDEKWDNFTKEMQDALNKNCPIKEITTNNKIKQLRPEYMTEGLWTSRKNIQKLTRTARKKPEEKNEKGITNAEDLKQKTKLYQKIRRQSKRKHYNTKFKETKHNSKETWKLLNEITGKTRKNTEIKELKINNKIENDKVKIADEFNTFFSQVGKTTGEEIPNVETDPLAYLRGEPPRHMTMQPILPCEILYTTKFLKSKKSKGSDGIPSFITIQCIPYMLNTLCHLLNNSLIKETFPTILKEAAVIPLYKKKSKTDPSNYRPVSLLNGISKLYEKILFNRIYAYIEQTEQMNPNQFGFRPGHSTQDLMYFIEKLDNAKYCIINFFDLKKAFDTIDRDILIKKLTKMGITGRILEILKSYFSNRKQYVQIGETRSGKQNLNYGVPQGSILGPLIFILYTNCVTKATDTLTGIYADDTTCISFGNTKQEALQNAQKTLDDLGIWFAANRLALSPSKCKFAVLNKELKTEQDKSELTIYGTKLQEIRQNSECTSNPFVGLLISENLDYKEQLQEIRGKLRSGLHALRKNKSLPRFTKRNIYFALCHSHMVYAGSIIRKAKKQYTKGIEAIQDNCIKAIAPEYKQIGLGETYKRLKLTKLKDKQTMQSATYGHKHFYGGLPKTIEKMIETGNGRSLIIKYPKYNHTKTKNLSPISNTAEAWNNLPEHIRKISKLKTFRKTLQEHLTSKY